ncbi:aspartyl-phosphate phosphatase Spo0E family protein [Paenibacillus xylanilyticus]|uniref:aspartyl-phosphate phosphatase Spo0E family protein n=1 Tax=Paenibacillus xylanilyticus TaxID=248903 RepID=UPI0028AAA721|nr:aspartyl-phosphate phosphatase Spo0E family protein [Paenibacillus xylanilyticus]
MGAGELMDLKCRIEVERQLLNELATNYGINDSRTIMKSQELDLVLNQYNELIKNKKPTA